jgi:hypothetical protein
MHIRISITLSSFRRQNKEQKISADRAHAKVTEEISAEDWHEQELLLVLRLSSDTRKISKKSSSNKFAEASSGRHTDETSEDVDEVELDEACDLNADRKIQC